MSVIRAPAGRGATGPLHAVPSIYASCFVPAWFLVSRMGESPPRPFRYPAVLSTGQRVYQISAISYQRWRFKAHGSLLQAQGTRVPCLETITNYEGPPSSLLMRLCGWSVDGCRRGLDWGQGGPWAVIGGATRHTGPEEPAPM
jgi:hypothetical protein